MSAASLRTVAGSVIVTGAGRRLAVGPAGGRAVVQLGDGDRPGRGRDQAARPAGAAARPPRRPPGCRSGRRPRSPPRRTSSLVTRAPSGASSKSRSQAGGPKSASPRVNRARQVRLLPGQQRLRIARRLPEGGQVHLPGGPEVGDRGLEHAARQVRRPGQAVAARRHREGRSGWRRRPASARCFSVSPVADARASCGGRRGAAGEEDVCACRRRRLPRRAGCQREGHAGGHEGRAEPLPLQVISCHLDSRGGATVPGTPCHPGRKNHDAFRMIGPLGCVSSLGSCAEFFRRAARGPRLAGRRGARMAGRGRAAEEGAHPLGDDGAGGARALGAAGGGVRHRAARTRAAARPGRAAVDHDRSRRALLGPG